MQETGAAAASVVLRNDAGMFLGAQAKQYDHCIDALSVEALACRDGLLFAERCGVANLHMETDCQELVRLWEIKDTQCSSIMGLIKEMLEISCNFVSFKLSFANRVCNKVAHELAKQAITTAHKSSLGFVIWEGVAASCLLPGFIVKHVKRERKGVAHELAQLAKRTKHAAMWRLRAPVCVQHLIAREVNSISE
ncbi:hypothetical protein EJB05_49021, partial [Eragrostis curvula]